MERGWKTQDLLDIT